MLARVILLVSCMVFGSCAFKFVKTSKNIKYSNAHDQKLDVYAPEEPTEPKDVIVFIHGGRWKSGRKTQYKFLGKRLARKGIVAVIIDYRLSPETAYEGMTTDAAMALKWVKENASGYGGDDERIFISGHSAGGHLAALVSADNHYFDSLNIKNPIQGTILIDAFGLDMYSFLSNRNYEKEETYYSMFSKDPATWKRGSPITYISQTIPPILILTGEKTYPAIKESNESFLESVSRYHPDTEMIVVENKKHVAMITQFFNSKNKAYGQIIHFMKSIRNHP